MIAIDTEKSKKPTGNGKKKKNNKIKDAYHKLSLYLVTVYDINLHGKLRHTRKCSKTQIKAANYKESA